MPEQLRGNENYSIWKPVSGHVVDANTDPDRIKQNRVDQDRVVVNDTQGIYVLCDGVAGKEGGREAAELVSKTAADSLARAIEQPNMPVTETWRKFALALQAAQQALRGRKDFPAADTTAVLAKVERGAKGTRILEGVSIGDSRAYVWDGSVEDGQISMSKVQGHLMRYRWNPEEAVKNVSELLQVQKYEQSVA
jgi:serine/threonine protein phosphatase PrpC